MNTRIARKLNECRRESDEKRAARLVAADITNTHNAAVGAGFLELPMLEFGDAYVEDSTISMGVRPMAGLITLNDLYNLKTAWGADEVNVMTADGGVIELVFKK